MLLQVFMVDVDADNLAVHVAIPSRLDKRRGCGLFGAFIAHEESRREGASYVHC